MVKGCRLPGNGGVTGLAGLRETPGDVVRIRSALEVFKMTGCASRAGQAVVVVDVAIEADAGRIGMRIGEREADAGMVEFCVKPGVRPMASLAGRGEAGGDVVWVGCGLKVLGVARVALGGETLKLPGGGTCVARFAVYGRVCANQWEAILVVAYRLHSDIPTFNRVTRFTIGAELRAVNVGMAV